MISNICGRSWIMENASKALMMAGGVLIAIIIIGLLIMGFNTIRQYPIEQENVRKTQQTAAFNREFEAYNRDHVLGTEVITVMRKAIDNNKKYIIDPKVYNDEEKAYDIDVKFTITSDIEEYYVIYSPILNETVGPDGKIVYSPSNSTETNNYLIKKWFYAGKNFSVLDIEADDRTNEDIRKFFLNDNREQEDITYTYEDDEFKDVKSKKPKFFSNNPEITKLEYIKKITGFTQFKRKTFKCTGVEYNIETGRINLMTFEEI